MQRPELGMGSLEVGIQMVVNCCVGAEHQAWVLWKDSVLLTAKLLIQAPISIYKLLCLLIIDHKQWFLTKVYSKER